jgi:hypothetical protein
VDKPCTVEEYVIWAKKNINADWDGKSKRYYDAVSESMRRQFQESKFWQTFLGRLKDLDAEYLLSTSYEFRPPRSELTLYVKPYESVVDKSFRKNILQNPDWPKPPSGGWIDPHNFYVHINDIVRTSVTVKYLDGVEMVTERLRAVGEEQKTETTVKLEARDSGYYAGHVDVRHEFEIPTQSWDTNNFFGSVEIQITTQVKEVIKQLTHKYYEERRVLVSSGEAKKWQWDYTSQEFVANYLGHILHYLEGMILDLRDRRQH